MNTSFEMYLKNIQKMILNNTCPHLNLYCAKGEILLNVVKTLLPIQHKQNKELLFNIYLTEIQVDSTTCESLYHFLNAKSSFDFPKIVIVHQFSEKLNDTFVTCFEEYIKESNTIFIFLITTMHNIEHTFVNKTVTLTIPINNNSSDSKQWVDINESLSIYNLLESDVNDQTLAETVIEFNKINTLRNTIVPNILLDDWKLYIEKKIY